MMTTYFHGGSEIQADNNLQTLYLVNPSYGDANYSDAQTPSNMFLLNPGATAPPPQPSHHLVGVPLGSQGSANFWGSTADPATGGGAQHQIPTAVPIGSGGGGVEAALAPADHHYRRQGLSLSLNDGSPHENAAGDGYGKTTAAGGAHGVVLRSKYRAAAQELLDEVVNVEMALTKAEEKRAKATTVAESGEGSGGMGVGGGEIPAKQEIQVKKARLLSMLDEVEQRYRVYHSQMQQVASAFEQAAGPGSSRSYTALALQTISRQFRCLKDAIAAQIKAAGVRLGGGSTTVSRMRVIEDEMIRQRQQVDAWRPQRGLPERAVSVLRAWLFEHFLHPYPKDTDKHMLAKQSGLTRSQVSNWFINARVRLWKPMVEEMYLEELKSQDQNNASQDTTNTTSNNKQNDNAHNHNRRNPSSSALHPHQQPGSAPMSPPPAAGGALQGFSFIGSTLVGQPVTRQSPKRHRSPDVGPASEEVGLGHGGYGSYMVEGIGSRFDPDMGQQQYHQGNGVSLTLGPPHCEGLSLVTSQSGAAPYDIWD